MSPTRKSPSPGAIMALNQHQSDAFLSPSDLHQHLMREIKPAMAYDGGDFSAWQARLRPEAICASEGIQSHSKN
jgi:hypothetical protein